MNQGDLKNTVEPTENNGEVLSDYFLGSSSTITLGPAKMAKFLKLPSERTQEQCGNSKFLKELNDKALLIERVKQLVAERKLEHIEEADARQLLEMWVIGKREIAYHSELEGGVALGYLEQKFKMLSLMIKCFGINLDEFSKTVDQVTALDKAPAKVASAGPLMNQTKMAIILAAIWCIILATADFDDQWVFDLSKWALCLGSIYHGYLLFKAGARRWLIPLGILAVIFNPIAPIQFEEDQWEVVDWIAAGVFLSYLWCPFKITKGDAALAV